MNKSKKSIILFIFIFAFLSPVIFTNFDFFEDPIYNTPITSDWERGGGNLSQFNDTISEGDNLLEDIYYNFTSDLIDPVNSTQIYDAGYLETEFKDGTWHTPDYDNITVQDLINYNNYIPGFDDFYDIVGNLSGWVDLSLAEANDGLFSTFYSTNVSYYPGTFSFTNDIISGDPAGWVVVEPGVCTVNVIETIGGHRNILELYDGDANVVEASRPLTTPQTSGVIEFWIRTDDVTQETYLALMDGGTGGVIGINLRIETANLQEESAGWANFDIVANDVWYHIKVVFDCGTYGLEGLDADTYHIFVNNVYIGTYDFANVVADIDTIYLYSDAGDAIYSSYWDAFGFDWIANYSIGDNYNWNYYPATYDLENHNTTLSGNYYGTDSFDYGTEPEVYYGTYDFRDDADGVVPAGWDDVSTGAADVSVVASYGNHLKLVVLEDPNGVDTARINENFDDGDQVSGTIEFWVRNTIASEVFYMYVYQNAAAKIRFKIDDDLFQWRGLGAWTDTGHAAPVDDTWYHIRFDFECGAGTYQGLAADTWYVSIDGTQYGAYDFQAVADYCNNFTFMTDAADSGHDVYIDAVGYSWDTTSHVGYGYTVGYNINPYDLVPLLEAGYEFDISYGTSVNIENNVGGHNNVLELDNTNNVAKIVARRTFTSAQSYGTYEWWWRTDDAAETSQSTTANSGTTTFAILIITDKFRYYDGAWNDVGLGATDDTWYHIRVDFECTANEYQDLPMGSWHVFINGVKYGEYRFANPETEIDTFFFGTGNAATDYYQYIDALAYSWDSDYCSNETTWNYDDDFKSWNKNPYDLYNNTDLFQDNWDYYGVLGGSYSIDGEFANHKKYLELYDDSDTDYFRGTDSFDYGTAPEWYYSTYDFTDDAVGTFPVGWSTENDATIIASKGGHNKVLMLDDPGAGQASAGQVWSGAQNDETMEFWWWVDDLVGWEQQLHFFIVADTIGYLYGNGGDLFWFDFIGSTLLLAGAGGVWLHISMHFIGNVVTFYINGAAGIVVAFEVGKDSPDRFRFDSNNGKICWIDAVGYSWDTTSHSGLGYTPSYNINPYYLEPLLESGWTHTIGIATSISIEDNIGNHKNVLALDDQSAASSVSASQIFDVGAQESGTIEFWARATDVTDYNGFTIRSGGTAGIIVALYVDGWRYHDGIWNLIVGCADNTWYHVKIDFECGAGGYDGLAADEFNIHINGVEYGDYGFSSAIVSADRFYAYTLGADSPSTTCYIDALGYSWDPNYITATNMLGSDNYNDIGLQIWNTFETNETDGTLSFWINGDFDDLYEYFRIYLMQDNDFITSIKINQSYLFYLDGTSWVNSTVYVSNTWHYVRFYFDTVADTYDLWFDYSDYTYCDDGINFNMTLIDSDVPFQQTTTGIDRIMFETTCGTDIPTYKIDALLYSWVNATLDLNLIPDTYAEFDIKIALDVSDDYYYIGVVLYWAFLTESDEYVNFTWYNFDTDTWDVIIRDYFEDSDGTPGPWTEYYNSSGCFNSTFLDPYINSTGGILFRFKILDFNDEFEVYFDELRVFMRGYVHPTIEKEFDWRGIWRYRWFLRNAWNASWLWTDWIYYEVIPLFGCANFEGVSESPYSTYWKLLGSGTTVVERFSDDMDAGTWDLDGVGSRTFEKTVVESVDYLLNNYSLSNNFGYTGTHWYTFAQTDFPSEITWDGTNFFIIDMINDEVYKYTAAGAYVSSWDTSVQTNNPSGITWDGTNFFIIDMTDEEVYKYTAAGAYVSSWDTSVQTNSPNGITWDGTNFFILDAGDKEIYKYTAAGAYVSSWDISVQTNSPSGITWDGTNFFILDAGDEEVYKYTAAGAYVSSWEVSGHDIPIGITWDGTNFFIYYFNTEVVYEYAPNNIISKYYYGGSLIYMQTDVTETLNLRNTQYGSDISVVEGEYMYFYVNSTTENVKVKFYDDGVEQIEYTLLENNVNPNNQTILFNIDSDFTFDSLEFIGEDMSDVEYFVCYGYEVYGYTSSERVYDMYVDPDGKDTLMCQFGNYTLEIYERDGGSFSLQESQNITLTESLLTVIYVPARVWYLKIYHYAHELSDITITGPENRTLTAGRDEILELRLLEGDYVVNWTNGETGLSSTYVVALYSDQSLIFETTYYTVYFSLFDQYSRRVDDTLFSFYLNGTRKDFGPVELRSADYNITVYDYLSVSVFEQTITLETFTEYNIIITIFELEIRHLGVENSNITLFETTTHNHINFSMSPDSTRFFMLSNSTYNVTWVNGEDGYITNYDITLDENFILTLNTTFYIVYFSLYDQNGVRLDDSLFSLYINATRKDFGFVSLESNDVTVLVHDYLNITVFNQVVVLSGYTEYNIIITVFELQIRHLAQVSSNISISETTTHNHINFSMSPNSLNKYMLSDSVYNVTWWNGENNVAIVYGITLNINFMLTLNTTYHTIYFGLFTYDGLGLNRDWVRFYINGTRKDFGINIVESEAINITVLDYFNNTLASEIIDASVYSEYNIYVEVYSLYLLNRFTYYDLVMNITQVGSGYNMSQLVSSSSALLYRFIPNVNYTINATYINGTVYNIRTINLTENTQIESFGIASAPEEYPKNVYFGVYTTTGLGIDHDLLRFYIDSNRTDFGFNTIGSMIINITVTDYFNTTLFTQIINTSGIYEYDILITLYSLKIKNEARVAANYTLSLGVLETTGYILPEEIIEYQLATNNYIFIYTNNEDGSSDTININLNQDRVYILNSTYYTIYFSLFDQNGIRLDDSLFSLYLNSSRKDFGFVELESDDVTILVQDYLNFTAFNSVITLSGSTEYNIIITVYELQIRHLAQVNSNITLFETVTHNHINFSMSPDSLNKYMLSDSTYNITWTNGENSVSTTYDITLNINYILTLNTTYYNIYFTLFDLNLHVIDSLQYELRLNNTLQDFGLVTDLQTDDYSITVQDRFGTSLFNSIITLRGLSEYRIDITLYELQVRHLGQLNSNLTLNETTGHIGLNFSMAPNTITSFILGSSTYNITWINGEDLVSTTYDITLNMDYILTLNTSYYDIFFSLFDLNLHIINPSQYVFRLNGTIRDFGLITYLQTDDYTITVMDRFGTSLFNSLITLRGLNEYRIDITLYELQIRHLARVNGNISISETTTHNFINFSMSPNSLTSYILANSIYNITWWNGENGAITVYNINLNIDYILTLNTSYYDIFFSLFDLNLHTIDPNLYEFRLNSTREVLGFVEDLQTDDYIITIIDRFGISLFNNVVNLRGLNEYMINITLFELQIKHLARENSNLTLSETTTHNGLNFSMAPDTLQSFILGSSTYNVTWTNGENSAVEIYYINLNVNFILTLNTTYYSIWFSLYDQNGVRLEDSLFSLYINTTRKDFGPVGLESNSTLILVQDFLNVTVFNQVVALRNLNEYNIIITVFELQIRHLARVSSNLTLFETTTHNGFNFSMAPDTIRYFILSTSIYNVTWTNGENYAIITYDINLNVNFILTLNTTYYSTYFSLYDQGGVRLEDFLFSLYINNTRKDFGFVELESDDILILVQDFLNVTVFNQTVTITGIAEYNIIITVFELQIRHLGREISNVSISETVTFNFINFTMSPNSLNKYMLANSSYNVTWWNGENMVAITYNVTFTTLNASFVLTLNTTYFTVYFGLFTNDGLGLDYDSVRFTINSVRKDFGPVELEQDSNNLTVTDYFNETLYSVIVNLSAFTEWNIFVEIFTLYLFNNYTHFISIEIERNDIKINCSVPPQMLFQYRFLPNVEYKIIWNNENGTEIDSLEFELEDNGQIVSFGFYTAVVPYNPLPDMENWMVYWIIIIVFIVIFGGIAIVIYYKYKVKKLREKRRNPASTVNQLVVTKKPFY